MNPVIASIAVVLPAPLGPISATISPGVHLERQALDGDDAAVADVEVLDAEYEGCHADDRRSVRAT